MLQLIRRAFVWEVMLNIISLTLISWSVVKLRRSMLIFETESSDRTWSGRPLILGGVGVTNTVTRLLSLVPLILSWAVNTTYSLPVKSAACEKLTLWLTGLIIMVIFTFPATV